jgi:pilus assembly protein CpaC
MKARTRLLGVLFAFCLAACLGASPAAAQEEIVLMVGEQKTIDVSNIASVSLGEKKIASAQLVGNQLLLTGKGAGVTTLSLIARDGSSYSSTVKVLARDPKALKREVEMLLSDVEGVDVRIVGDRVFLDGYVYREEDKERAELVTEAFPGVVNLATFSKAYLTMRRLVQVDYYRYEVQTSNVLDMGLNWKDLLSGTQVQTNYSRLLRYGDPLQSQQTIVDPTTGDTSTYNQYQYGSHGGDVLITSDFNPVKFNQDDGRIRLLDSHQVVVKEGSDAEYHVGGEIPVIISTGFVVSVEYKPYGAIFKLTPELDRQDNINIKLDMELSEPDFSVAVMGVPGLISIRQVSELNLKSGESIAIGGFVQERHSKAEDGLPGLSQIPVLGYFLGSKNFRDETREGIVFITPTVASPTDSPRNDPRIRGVMEDFEKKDFRL